MIIFFSLFSEYIEEVMLQDDVFLLIKLSVDRIKLLKLEVNSETIRAAICCSKLKIKPADCVIAGDSLIKIIPRASRGVKNNSSIYYNLQFLRDKLPSIVIKGLPTVSRAIMHLDEVKDSEYYKQNEAEDRKIFNRKRISWCALREDSDKDPVLKLEKLKAKLSTVNNERVRKWEESRQELKPQIVKIGSNGMVKKYKLFVEGIK